MMQEETECKLDELLSLFSEDEMTNILLDHNLENLEEVMIKKLIHYQLNDNLKTTSKQTEFKIFDEV